jgi:hypothetical protein
MDIFFARRGFGWTLGNRGWVFCAGKAHTMVFNRASK